MHSGKSFCFELSNSICSVLTTFEHHLTLSQPPVVAGEGHCLFCFQQIATQIAVLIAKVARLDCPRQWPELIPILLESLKSHDGLQQHRALLTFYHVTKTLASKRLAQDRRLFQDVSSTLLLLFPF